MYAWWRQETSKLTFIISHVCLFGILPIYCDFCVLCAVLQLELPPRLALQWFILILGVLHGHVSGIRPFRPIFSNLAIYRACAPLWYLDHGDPTISPKWVRWGHLQKCSVALAVASMSATHHQVHLLLEVGFRKQKAQCQIHSIIHGKEIHTQGQGGVFIRARVVAALVPFFDRGMVQRGPRLKVIIGLKFISAVFHERIYDEKLIWWSL